MAALDEPDAIFGVAASAAQDILDPRSGGVDERLAARADDRIGRGIRQRHAPAVRLPASRNQRRAQSHFAAALLDVQRVEDDEPCIVNPAIGIFKRPLKFFANCSAFRRTA